MKKYINKILICALFTALVISSCDQDQEVADVIDATEKSLATVTPVEDIPLIVDEGETFVFDVALSKMVKEDIIFSSEETDENEAVLDLDYSVASGVIAPYAYTSQTSVSILANDFPQKSRQLSIDIGAYEWSDTWQISPESEVYNMTLEIDNVNDPDAFTVGLIWDDPNHEIDFDMYVFYEDLSVLWPVGGEFASATGSNPEVNLGIRTDYVDEDENPVAYNGTYYFEIDPYSVVAGDIPLAIHIGYPNGEVEIFETVFNGANAGDYVPGDVVGYKLFEIDKNGRDHDIKNFSFDVTRTFPEPEE